MCWLALNTQYSFMWRRSHFSQNVQPQVVYTKVYFTILARSLNSAPSLFSSYFSYLDSLEEWDRRSDMTVMRWADFLLCTLPGSWLLWNRHQEATKWDTAVSNFPWLLSPASSLPGTLFWVPRSDCSLPFPQPQEEPPPKCRFLWKSLWGRPSLLRLNPPIQ